jgi:hypothetical protein
LEGGSGDGEDEGDECLDHGCGAMRCRDGCDDNMDGWG